MKSDKEALLAVHSRALTGHDVETILGHAHQAVRCVCDGTYLGQGTEVLRKTLEAEYARNDGLIGRVMDLDGEPVVAEFVNNGSGAQVRGVLRISAQSQRITEYRIEHNQAVVDRLGRSAIAPH